MLLREDGRDVIAITQPHHAWVSAMLGRGWGGGRFRGPDPRDEVVLAAGAHDMGWLGWETAPELNPATGRPYSFLDLPLERHLGIWDQGPRNAMTVHRYAGLLVSMHATGLYGRSRSGEPPQALREFLERETAWQQYLKDSLRAEPRWEPYVRDEVLQRNQRLIAAWDALSLALCLGATRPHQLEVPGIDDLVTLTLGPADESRQRYTLEPWPFLIEPLSVPIEGRRLTGTYADDASLREALAAAPWVTLAIDLIPV